MSDQSLALLLSHTNTSDAALKAADYDGFDGRRAVFGCVHSARAKEISCGSLVVVGSRVLRDGLYEQLLARSAAWPDHGVKSVERIGDCLVPGAIVHAVYDGHRYAEELDQPPRPDLAERREHAFREIGAPAYAT